MLGFGLEKSLQHDFGHLRCEETLALRNGFHGFWEAVREIRLQHVTVSPGIQSTLHHLVCLVHGEHKNFGARNSLADLTYYFDSIQFGHAEIQSGYNGLPAYSHLNGLTAI